MTSISRLAKSFKFEIFILVAIAIYVVAAISVSLNRYWQFDAFWYDLGLYTTAIWKVAHFQLPIIEQFDPPQGKIIFADHFNPSLFLFSPIFWISNKIEAILILQAVMVGASAWLAFLIVRKIIKNKLVILSLITAYLGYVGLQNALYTDFHDTTVAIFFVMLLFWSIFNQKWWLYWASLIIVLGFKENMPGLGIGIGIFLILKKEREINRGLITIILSLLWFIAVTKMIIPAFSGGYFSYKPELPNSLSEAVISLFVPLELKARTIFLTFLTFGFAPLFSLPMMPAIIEHFAERFVFSPAATRWDLGFHYNATLSPLFLVASLPFVIWLSRKSTFLLNFWAISTILIVFFLHRFYLHGPLLLATHPVFYEQTKRAQFMKNFFDAIPKDRFIMTQNNVAAHLALSKVVLINLKNFEKINPDVVALDIHGGQNPNNFFPATYDEAQELAQSLNKNPSYRRSEILKNQFIFIRKP